MMKGNEYSDANNFFYDIIEDIMTQDNLNLIISFCTENYRFILPITRKSDISTLEKITISLSIFWLLNSYISYI